MRPFEPHRLNTVVLVQGAGDQTPHRLFLDDIRIDDDATAAEHAPPPPRNLRVKGYERHFDVAWDPVDNPHLAQYVIYRSVGESGFKPVGVQRAGVNRFSDYTGDAHMTARYRVTARTSTLAESAPSQVAGASTHEATDLRVSRCFQSRAELVFGDHHGTEPGTDGGDDRELPDGPGLEKLHGQS